MGQILWIWLRTRVCNVDSDQPEFRMGIHAKVHDGHTCRDSRGLYWYLYRPSASRSSFDAPVLATPLCTTTKTDALGLVVFNAWAFLLSASEAFLIRNSAFSGSFTRTGSGSSWGLTAQKLKKSRPGGKQQVRQPRSPEIMQSNCGVECGTRPRPCRFPCRSRCAISSTPVLGPRPRCPVAPCSTSHNTSL